MQNIANRINNHKAKVHHAEHFLPEQIERLQERANKQEKDIARWFYFNPNKAIGPTHLHQIFFPDFPEKRGDWEINSTRRAITNLTDPKKDKDGNVLYPPILIKTEKKYKSLLGGTEYKWRWRKPEDFETPEQADFFGNPEPVPSANGTYSGKGA